MKYDCPLCQVASETQKFRLMHVWAVHRRKIPHTLDSILHTCPWCFKKFSSVLSNLRHTKNCNAFVACAMSGEDVAPEKRQRVKYSKTSRHDENMIAMLAIFWIEEALKKDCRKW